MSCVVGDESSPQQHEPIDTPSPPESPTPNHSDLASFICYAKRTGLDEDSTVYVGTHYEYTVAQSLARYGFDVTRVGGAFDGGIDLVGTWTIPFPATSPLSMRVLIQCKAGSQRAGPRHIRELEGAFVGAPAGWRGAGVLAVLLSEYPATEGVRKSLGRSQWPMVRAQELGLEAYGVTVLHGGQGGLVLTHNGKPIPLQKV
ncbi:uncharacterized protein CPUR_01578 [Claviceps purpurea 20.1]|uniref:Restriction endonuclease type IV Mrr domain-containing protein n=1 Tax=Claviceps purpurea (strain 20.1) TaxID=1111077 RepID=M1WB80_CLAP2|nr:uncharacterized protein CPUR_01578 [Claviceps purpurea 20.1]